MVCIEGGGRGVGGGGGVKIRNTSIMHLLMILTELFV
jgi:hypothetical protein